MIFTKAKSNLEKFSEKVAEAAHGETASHYDDVNYIGMAIDTDCKLMKLLGGFQIHDLYQMREGSADNYFNELHARRDLRHEDTWALMAALMVKGLEKKGLFPHDIFLKAYDVAEDLSDMRIEVLN